MDNVIFSKYSNDRDEKFNIVTEIIKTENGDKKVKKYPFTYVAQDHINHIVSNSEKLNIQYKNTLIRCAKVEKCEEIVEIEWIDGEKFSVYLDELLQQGKIDVWKTVIDKYFNNMFCNKQISFNSTERFKEIFGNIELPATMESVENIDINMLFSNVIYNEKNWIIYNCEWFMEFCVPIKFLIYRCLSSYMNIQRNFNIEKDGIYESFGIIEQECCVFKQMEENFQKYILGEHIPMHQLYENIHGEVENVNELYYNKIQQKRNQNFFDFNEQVVVSVKSKEELQKQLDEINQKYNDILNSTCWKLTYPIRLIFGGNKR